MWEMDTKHEQVTGHKSQRASVFSFARQFIWHLKFGAAPLCCVMVLCGVLLLVNPAFSSS